MRAINSWRKENFWFSFPRRTRPGRKAATKSSYATPMKKLFVAATLGLALLSAAPASVSLWSDQATPAVESDPSTGGVEVGVKFRSSVTGYLTGLRFYKGPLNTGSHTGRVWTAGGTLLAAAAFTNETASGWQTQNFATPVAIASNTTYVASYWAPNGRYAITTNFFNGQGVTNFPLRALASGEDGPNGVFRAGTAGFPTNSAQAANYWVDVRFVTSINGADTNPPTLAQVQPPPGTVGQLTNVTVVFSELVANVRPDHLRLNGAAATTLSGGGTTWTFGFAQPPYGPVDITWTPGHGITDLASPANGFNATAPGATWSYQLVDTNPPVVAALDPQPGQSLAILRQVEVTFSEDVLGVDAADLLINGVPATNLVSGPGQPYRFEFPQPAAGTVNFNWSPVAGITDTAGNPFAGGGWPLTLDPALPAGPVVISEFLAANIALPAPLDEDGERQDWIELHNRGTNAVNLAGWALTDDAAVPGLWPLPARTLGPGQFLVVLASGKDRRPAATNQNLHTNFKLARRGEHLGLYTPDAPRQLASGFTPYPEQRNDISFGYDAANQLRYFSPPTPGAGNGTSSIVGVVEPVHANVARGYFDAPFALVLSCPTPGAVIRYTTNGAEPTADSAVFPGALTVSNTLLLRAAGFKTNHLPSLTTTHTYLFNLPASLRSLPAISIVTDSNHLWGPTGIWGINGGSFSGPDGLWVSNAPGNYHNPSQRGPAWERPTSIEWIDPKDHAGFQADAGLRISGSDYRRPRIRPTTKVSFRVYFRGDYGEGRLTYPGLFPLTAVSRFDNLVLRGGFDDEVNPFIRDELHRRLAHDTGQVAAHGTLAILFLNGQPMTFFNPTNPPYYNPTERINEEFCQEYFNSQDKWDVITQVSASGSVVDGTRTDFESLVAYVDNNNPATTSVFTNIARRLDLTNFVDYLMVNTWGAMGDWPGNNWRAARPRVPNGQWRFLIWDAEYGMGLAERDVTYNLISGTPSGPYDNNGLAGSTEIARLHQRLYNNFEYRLLWADRAQRHFFNGGALTRANVTNRLETLRLQLLPLLANMDGEFRNWAQGREPIYFNQMRNAGLLMSRGAPTFSQHGGRVPQGFTLGMTHTNAAGTIYYTTDGTDPRVPFSGNLATNAAAYTNPVPLNASVTVKARVRDGTNWSALTEAAFTFAALGNPVVISEIMYNPVGGNPYEFLELHNPSAGPAPLGGAYFNGVTFVFPVGTVLAPGARLVLGNNTSTNDWKLRYPGVNPFGWFGGNLNNAGERIELFAADGTLLTSVDYRDTDGWPKEADGPGRSLELIHPAGDPDDPANWQASAAHHGTPGAANSAPPATAVILHELQADNATTVTNGGTQPDWIELRNLTASPVSVAGWSLTDDGNERKYVFPPGATVPANGFLLVWCDAATNAPGLHTGFALARAGEFVALYNASTTRVDAVSFGPQLTDYALGRIANAWTLTLPTPNAPNVAAPLAAPTNLALNEWLADSLPGQPDWLELFNRSTNLPVSLQGLYFSTSNSLFQLRSRSFLPPLGFIQLTADRGVGPTNLDFTLAAAGDRIALYDATGELLEQVAFGAQTQGVSVGRLPDGAANAMAFPGTASPGAANYLATYTGPVLNEILARNRSVSLGGFFSDFVELRHPGPGTFDLSGMSLSVDTPKPGQFTFPPGTTLAAGAHLLVTCDSARPVATNPAALNHANSLKGEAGGVWLFNAAGQIVDAVEYGFQIDDLSIGLSGGQWRLLASPTPGAANSPPAPLGTNTALRVNEWMPLISGSDDWFELVNLTNLPVDLATVALTDDPSLVGRGKFRPAPLSFIAANGFVQWQASGSAGKGLNHVNFALNAAGESLLVHRVNNNTNFTLVDAVAFGAQTDGVSQGRLPDGAPALVPFPGSPTPAASNYRLLTNIAFSEILTHTDPPFEDAIECQNLTAAPLDIGRWYLSDDATQRRKYQFPPGTTLAPGGFLVAYENQFGAGTNGFALSSVYGEELWLSAADAGGNETGDRLPVTVGPAFNGVSFGRVVTSTGVDFAPLLAPTFGVNPPASVAEFRTGAGAPNTAPRLSPVVLNEVMYHPPGGGGGNVEFIELHNRTATNAPLFHPAFPTNTWRLADGTTFQFPTNFTLPPGGFALLVEFNPATNATALNAFRALHNLNPAIPVLGPLLGGLNNTTDDLGLYAPDNPQTPPAPDAGFVPYVRVDRVNYRNSAPWPVGPVSGGGHSLQRFAATLYGNEALHWFSAPPTPGAPNLNANADSDGDGIPDLAEIAMGLNPFNPADALLDPDGDGANNLAEYRAGTDHLDPNSVLRLTAALHNGALVLTFPAVSNRTYSVLAQDSLPGTNWTVLATVPASPTSGPVALTNPPAAATRFFRVITPALP